MLSPEIVVNVVVELEVCGDLVVLFDDWIVLVIGNEIFVGTVFVDTVVVVVVVVVDDVVLDVALFKAVDISF
jgi:hypothetical protein